MKFQFVRAFALIALALCAVTVTAQQSFLVVTRGDTPGAVVAAIEAANPLHNGEGITAAGAVASFTDAGETLPIRGDDVALIWPDGGSAPYVWFVAPEGDDGVFSVYYGGLAPVIPAEIEQRLLIDGLLYRIGSAQIPGTAAPQAWSVGLNRSDAEIDASARSVEIPTAGKVRAAKNEPPERVVKVTGGESDARNPRHALIVWDDRQNRWEWILVSTFLRDIYTATDAYTRYVALKAYDPASPDQPAFTATEMLAGESVEGVTIGVAFPTVPVGAERVWVAIAIPTGVPFAFWNLGITNSALNQRQLFLDSDVIRAEPIGTDTFDIYVSRAALFATRLPGYSVYFDADSVNP